MKLYAIDDTNMNNLLTFLNKVEYKGLTEVQAVVNILESLKHPISDDEHPPN